MVLLGLRVQEGWFRQVPYEKGSNMAVRFVVDSASDMVELAEPGCVDVMVPLTVAFSDESGFCEEYLDGVTLSHAEFYEKLIESDALPQTSQAAPYAFSQAFRQVIDEGDTVVCVTVSSKVSGTNASALAAAKEFPGKVFVVDSLNAAIGERVLVEYGMQLREEGLSAADIAAKLEEVKGDVVTIGLLDTLEYLRKGGRISATVALAGNLLSIKPVIFVDEGTIGMLGKARGSKKGNNLLMQSVEKAGGVDFSRPCAVAYTGLSDEYIRKYLHDSRALWQDEIDEVRVFTIGCAIGTHIGPGAIAVAFFAKNA